MGKEVKRVWSYPSFAWFWDNDRESLLKRLKDTASDFPNLIEKHNLEMSSVADYERFGTFYFVIWRNGKTSKIFRDFSEKGELI